jgi:transposase
MHDATLFGGSADTNGAGRRGRRIAAGDRHQVRRQPSCVIKLMQRWQQHGTLEPAAAGGGRRAKLADHAERVHELLAATPDLTLAELLSALAAAGIATSRSAIGRFLNARGLTRKKRPRTPPSRSGRTSPPRGALGARSSRR